MAIHSIHGLSNSQDNQIREPMTNLFAFRFVARNSRTDDYVLIQMRVTLNTERVSLGTTGIRCLAKNWDAKNQKIRGEPTLQRLLELKKQEVYGFYYDLEAKKYRVTAAEFKRIYLKPYFKPVRFTDLCEAYLQSASIAAITKSTYQRRYKAFMQYMPRDLLAENISPTHFRQFREASAKAGNGEVYSNKVLQAVKSVIAWGVSSQQLTKSGVEFVSTGVKYKVSHTFLTPDELQKLAEYSCIDKNLELIRLAFLFSCYSGLEISAVKNLQPHSFLRLNDRYFLSDERRKTKTKRLVPLRPEAVSILNDCPDFYLALPSTSHMNQQLKVVAALAGIERAATVKWHDGRKTFAYLCLNVWCYSMEVTAMLMGQTSIKELKPYAAVGIERVLREFDTPDNQVIHNPISATI